MARDKIAEIAAVRGRSKGHRQSRALSECRSLEQGWGSGRGTLGSAPLFVVIRLVTVLEVFVRSWVAEIIDSGDPYTSRAADIIKGAVKIDFALAQALVGKKLTFGELVSHEIAVNGLGDIDRVLQQLLATSVWGQLKGVVDRWEVEIRGAAPEPIIEDVDQVKAELASLFDVRHIAVHELPDENQVSVAQIDGYLEAASCFMRAIDQSFGTMLDGDYPLTQLEMNIEAGDKARIAQGALEDGHLHLPLAKRALR